MLEAIFKGLDRYTIGARLMPALFVLLPVVLGVVSWFPEHLNLLTATIGIVALFGGAAFLAQISRDSGKALQRELFRSWGGAPSSVILRHRDPHLNPETKKRYHQALSEMLPGTRLPTPEEEKEDPDAADRVYASCGDFLREQTRDTQQFPVLIAENINYGMRRNLLGMKKAAIMVAIIGSVVSAVAVARAWLSDGNLPVPVIAFLISLFCLLWWSIKPTPEWVRMAAFSYAERLLSACDQLTSNK